MGNNLYLDLMKRCLVNEIYPELETGNGDREGGSGCWPSMAHTMIGKKRLENVQLCAETVLRDNIPGDFLEAGVWRGGTTILMRAILKAWDIVDRQVWVADSFKGLPHPTHPMDGGSNLHTHKELAIPLSQVKINFDRYSLLDDQVKFLEGWFKDTLPSAPIEKLSILRADGDMYESTRDIFTNLYTKLSIGGFVIIDDYLTFAGCQKAVTEYREVKGINDPIINVDWTAVYWRKTHE